jgi:plasmid stabilization system protein ParE
VRKIGDACHLLEDHPYAGRPRDEVRTGLRSLAVRPLVVLYRVRTEGIAEIVRVIDGRRDIDEIFADPPSDPTDSA